jgi:CubicO group peptidase (beta-lactamase class C family)
LLACWLLGSAAARAADYAGGTVVRGPLGAKLDEYLRRLADWGFSGTVLVARDGEVILAKGYGLADREKRRPVTTDTVISVGSITKQFTAAAILKLETQGKLGVHDPLRKYLPGVPGDKAAITLHHLLTHSAGLASDFGDDYEKVSRDELVKRALASQLLSKPGERYAYSNTGYSLLGAVVEIVSGRGYEEYLYENLFKPAGMTRTGYRIPRWDPADLAVGYERGRRWGTEVGRPWAEDGPYWCLRANGGIHSTVGDMYRWHRALEGDKVLPRAAREKLFAPHVPADDHGTSHYGYGWSISKTDRGTRLVGHDGSNGIFYADFRRYVDEGVMSYHATNVEVLVGGRVGSWIERVIFGGDYPNPPAVAAADPAVLAKYAGSYRLPSGGRLAATVEAGRLTLTAEGPDALGLLGSGERGDARSLNALSARTAAIMEARAKGDVEPLYQALGGRLPRARLKEITAQTLREQEAGHGPYQGFEVLGSFPVEGGRDSYVRWKMARGPVFFRFVWDGERLRGVRSMPSSPAARTFLPQSATEFAAFGFDLPTVVRVRFDTGTGESVTGLTVRARDGDVTARKGER